MNNDERELDLALAEAEQENSLLRARSERLMIEAQLAEKKIADYEGLIRDLTDALRANPERNTVLEEVAVEFDRMTSLGDTAASFAAYVRGMKK